MHAFSREWEVAMPLLMCPNCEEGMQAIQRNEVEIDVCPKCRGVWLDRGELEKLLGAVRETEKDYREMERSVPEDRYPKHHPKHKKKKSMFEMFDIFD